jgi:hypothetical protein
VLQQRDLYRNRLDVMGLRMSGNCTDRLTNKNYLRKQTRKKGKPGTATTLLIVL